MYIQYRSRINNTDSWISHRLQSLPGNSVSESSTPRIHPWTMPCGYRIVFRKLPSLIPFRRPFLIASRTSSLALTACSAPATLPSPAGRSMLWCSRGILGSTDLGAVFAARAAAREARRRCFLDLAARETVTLMAG